jgi:hypothetical protein
MKSPNESNLDEWLFHYFEGDLSSEQESQLEEFLLDNPKFDSLFEAWGASRIQQESFSYPYKQALLKPLISFAAIHKVAVFSAIAINAVLAGFIIFGNQDVKQSYQMVRLDEQHSFSGLSRNEFNYSREDIFTADITTSLTKPTEKSNEKETGVFSQTADNEPEQFISSHSIPSTSEPDDKELKFIRRLEQVSFLSMERELSQEEGTTDIRSELPVSSNATIFLDPQENLRLSSYPSIKNESIQSPSSFGVEVFGLNQEENQNVSSNHKHIINLNVQRDNPSSVRREGNVRPTKAHNSKERDSKESTPKEQKTPINPRRYKGGDLLLTNTRRQEYLIPAVNRNQINFGHVASDFSNSAFVNSYLQWPGKNNQLTVNQLGYDMFIPQIKSGLGIQMMYSAYGDGSIRDFETALTYAPKFFLSKNLVIEPAIRLKMGSTSVNRAGMTPGTWIEMDRGNAFIYTQQQHEASVNRSIQQDLGLGLLLNTKWAYFGLNADNIVGDLNHALYYGAEQNWSRIPMYFNAVIGSEYESINKKILLSGQLIYQNHGSMNKLWSGARVKFNYISLGASVSSMGEPMLSAGFVSKSLSILYSSDYSYSRMYNDKFLSHQLLLRIILKESRMKKILLN